MAIRLAFGHKEHSGKTTAASYIVEFYSATKLSFADPIKDIAHFIQTQVEGESHRDAMLYCLVGQTLKTKYGDDVWVQAMEKRIEEAGPNCHIVIDDLRFTCEAEMLKRRGFTLCNLVRDREEESLERPKNIISETEMDNSPLYDGIIYNNGSIQDFYESLDELVSLCQ